MNEETIVAVYDSAEHATAAVNDLHAAGISAGSISQTARGNTVADEGYDTMPKRETGFWSSLFGGEPDHDTSIYDRTVAGGSTVVTVRVSSDHYDHVASILEKHHPIDLDERANSYGIAKTTTTGTTHAGMAAAPVANHGKVGLADETLQLAEETIAIGKRAVMGGTTRIRKYVVETPVHETVTLHSERVELERRPVTDGRAIGDHAFADRTIEMTETSEEAVIVKNVRVVEEIGLRKIASDHVETVSDTVRREEVKIEKVETPVTMKPTTPKI